MRHKRNTSSMQNAWLRSNIQHISDDALMCKLTLERYIEQRDSPLESVTAQAAMGWCHITVCTLAEAIAYDKTLPAPMRVEAMGLYVSYLALHGKEFNDRDIVVEIMDLRIRNEGALMSTLSFLGVLPRLRDVWPEISSSVYRKVHAIQRRLGRAADSKVGSPEELDRAIELLRREIRKRSAQFRASLSDRR